jgi:hypothetical protein
MSLGEDYHSSEEDWRKDEGGQSEPSSIFVNLVYVRQNTQSFSQVSSAHLLKIR